MPPSYAHPLIHWFTRNRIIKIKSNYFTLSKFCHIHERRTPRTNIKIHCIFGNSELWFWTLEWLFFIFMWLHGYDTHSYIHICVPTLNIICSTYFLYLDRKHLNFLRFCIQQNFSTNLSFRKTELKVYVSVYIGYIILFFKHFHIHI